MKILFTILGLAIVIGLIAYLMKTDTAIQTESPTATSTEQRNAAKVSSVTLAENDTGNTITIAHATLTQPGYVVIYRTDAQGKVTIAGNTKLLAAGSYETMTVSINPRTADKETFAAIVHADNGDGTFSPKDDQPLSENQHFAMDVDVIGLPRAEEDARLLTRIEAYLNAQVEVKPLEVTVHGANYKFTPNIITAKEGQKVKVTFVSDGGLHDFTLDEFNVKTKQLQSGGSETVEFTADKKGTFKYYCSVGNHRAMGMEGTLTVE
jgi:plastocyanin